MEDNGKKIILEDDEINVDLSDRISIIVNKDHSKLDNLDYAHSGHTGFASTEHLNLLVPRRLSTMPRLNMNSNRQNAYIYIDNNGVDSKVDISTLLGCLIRKGDSVPQDMQPNEYLFLEIKED